MRRRWKVAIALAVDILATIGPAASPLHLGTYEAAMVVTSLVMSALIFVALLYAVAKLIDLATAIMRRRRSRQS